MGLIRVICSWLVSIAAVPREAEFCACMNRSIALRPQYDKPSDGRIMPPVLTGSLVHPILNTLISDAGHPSTPIASTTARPTGLFAHTPPSTNGDPLGKRCVGKYVGAAEVDRATSTTSRL